MISFIKYLSKTKKLNNGLSGISLSHHFKIYKEWKQQLESKQFPLDAGLPWITIVAKNFIEKYLKDKSKESLKVFEFGSGGSSSFFLKYANEVVSIEHDPIWYKLVKEKIEKGNIQGWSGFLHEPEKIDSALSSSLDPGNPIHYYTSTEVFKDCSFKQYVTSIDKYSDNYFDIVLVDGRSRPACLMHSINKVKTGGLLILDNAEREYYFSNEIVKTSEFDLMLSTNGALICYEQFTQTNIYLKK